MALQHNLWFPSGAPMLSFAWHAEHEPSSGLLDIFSHALVSRSCERNLSGSDAAVPPAWMQTALTAARGCGHIQQQELLPSRIPGASRVSSPWAAEARARIAPKRCYCWTMLTAGFVPAAPRREGHCQKGLFSPKKKKKKGVREGRKKILKALIMLLHSGRTRVGVCVGTVLAEGKLH